MTNYLNTLKPPLPFNEFQLIWAAEYTRYFPEEKISLRVPQQKLYDDEILQKATYVDLEIQNWNRSQMNYTIKTNESIDVIQKNLLFSWLGVNC